MATSATTRARWTSPSAACAKKIEDNPAVPAYILTRRGVGYYFSAQA